MRKANKIMTIILIGLLGVMLTVAYSARDDALSPGLIAFAEDAIVINEINVNGQEAFSTGAGTSGNPYLIESAGHFVKAMKDGNACYRLTRDVIIQSPGSLNWAPAANFTGEFDGAGYTITFSASVTTGGADYGLFTKNSGLIKNVKYVFSGSFRRNGASNYGGFVGVNADSGIIDNCDFTITGTIDVRGNGNDQVIVAGGVIGYNLGNLNNSSVYYMANIKTSSNVNPDHNNIDTVAYSGGVIGYNKGVIFNTDIEIYGSVEANNNHERDVFIIPIGSRSGALFASGGVIGYTIGGAIDGCIIKSSSSICSIGIDASFGASGGIVGMIENIDGSGEDAFSIVSSNIEISSSMQTFSAYEDANNLYAGGIVGRMDTTEGTFESNVINLNITTDNLLSAKVSGCVIGQGDFNAWAPADGCNVWFIIDRRSVDEEDFFGSGTVLSQIQFNTLDVRGSGKVTGEVNPDDSITLNAEPVYSPLYGWMSNASTNSKITSNCFVYPEGNGVYNPIKSTERAKFEALFIKEHINQAGDLNVLAELTEAGANWSWMNFYLDNDITATGQYAPIGTDEQPFNGKFYGQNHKITYTSATLIKGKDCAGIFGYIAPSGRVYDLEIAFGGEIKAENLDPAEDLFGDPVPRETNVFVGILAGVCQGEVYNVNVLATSGSQVRSFQTSASFQSVAGGLIGLLIPGGKLENISLTMQGKVHAVINVAGGIPMAGGLVGMIDKIPSGGIPSRLQNISIAIEGEVIAFDKELTGATMYAGGLVGNYEESTVIDIINGSVSISKTGIFGNEGLGGEGNGTLRMGAISSNRSTGNLNIDNFWVILDISEDSINGMKMFGDDADALVTTTENRLFISDGIVQAEVDTHGQISMSVPIGAGEIFAGWFMTKEYEGMLRTPEQGVYGNVFRPQTDSVRAKRYTKVITSIIYTYGQLLDVAHFTNQGNDFSGEEFILGANIEFQTSFVPIGDSPLNKFNGTFNGGGLKLKVRNIDKTEIPGEPGVAAIFGYVGPDAHIYGFNVDVVGTISNSRNDWSCRYSAVLAAYNEGTIGLDSPSQKTVITLTEDEGFSGGVQGFNAAGLVAYNNGIIYNIDIILDKGYIEAGENTSNNAKAAGAVAINEGIVKNIRVYNNPEASIIVNGNGTNFSTAKFAGGAVAQNFGHLHSVVAIMRQDIQARGGGLSLIGGLLGYNASNDTSNLWMVSDNPEVEVFSGPEGTSFYGVSGGANSLSLYGPGTIEVIVEANPIGDEITKGGMIVFKSVVNDESGNRTFYGYMKDLVTGEMLANNEGVSDYIFTPLTTQKGISVYSVFALSKITNLSDLNNMSDDVNNGVNPKIVYNLMADITITGAYEPIGTADHPFNGIFRGNQKTITLGTGAPSIPGLFGIVAESGEIEFLNIVVWRTASELTGENVGAIAAVNNGVISNVNVEINKPLQATNAAGGIAGINNGVIYAAVVDLNYTVAGGVVYDGSIIAGNAAGGIAGINNNIIGSSAVQDIQVLFDANSKIKTSSNNSAAGGVAGINESEGEIQSAFMIMTGIIEASGSTTSAGGICGRNSGFIHNIYFLMEGNGRISSATAIGGLVGTNSGIVGDETVDENSGEMITVGLYNTSYQYITGNTAGQKTGGAVGVLNAGFIHNIIITIGNNIRAVNCAGGLVAEATGGEIRNIELTLLSDYYINGNAQAGGLIANNYADVYNVLLTIDGVIKCEVSDGVISGESEAGGAIGINNGLLNNMIINLKNDVIATYKGSVAAISEEHSGINVWALLSNSILTDVSESESTDFNSIKVVGDATFDASFDSNYEISFEILSFVGEDGNYIMWYEDISISKTTDVRIYSGKRLFVPEKTWSGKKYHVSFYRFEIGSVSALKRISDYINHNSFFNGVRFWLSSSLYLSEGDIIVPIGTEEYPFNGIFDGKNYTITFGAESAIGAVKYSGLFGYTGADSRIHNLILDINEGVIIGGQSPEYTGALAGYLNGSIENVAVNLFSTLRAKSAANIGGLAGLINPSVDAVNTWLIIHNASAKASSNSYYDDITQTNVQYGVNTMNIIGTGDIDVTIDEALRFKFLIPSGYIDPEEEEHKWYSDISTQTKLNSSHGDFTIYQYQPFTILKDSAFSVSFIDLIISSYSDLCAFSDNINTYTGFAGVQFILNADIVIDGPFVSIGTKSNPFSGIFEGNGHTISFAGISVYGSYPGLFGYVNSTALIQNLIVISNTTDNPNTFGDDNAIYSGLVASYCDGELKNIIAQVKNETTIYCVNKAGGMVGSIGENFNAVNSWVILREKSTIPASGVPESKINILYSAGKGSIHLQILNGQVTFTATPDGTTDPFYGYIDGTTTVNNNHTLQPSDSLYGARYTAIFLNSYITDYSDLVRLSETINSGLNYSGVVYNVMDDIVMENGFVPIGGLIGIEIVKFKGILQGNGYTFTIPEDVAIIGAYAGIFGYIDATGSVKNLRMEVYGTIGNDKTIYAGALSGYNEGTIENIAMYVDRKSYSIASTAASGFIGYTTSDVTNVWIVNYNRKDTIDRNNQGRISGHNTVTVLGAGEMIIDFVNAQANNYRINIVAVSSEYLNEWYYYLGGVKTQLLPGGETLYSPTQDLKNKINYISFLHTELSTYEDLLKLAEDTNEGYDFYNISFNLNNDIAIENGYPAIGGFSGAFNGTFNGNNYTISLPESIAVTGKYAGIFGKIDIYGRVSNLVIDLSGTLGDGGTEYAGAFAYNLGVIEHCVVSGYGAVINGTEYAGTVIGYDANKLIFNTWGIIASYNNIEVAGQKDTRVNKMKVVGVGRILVEIEADNSIKFTNDTEGETDTDITGWYRNYARGEVISNYLGIGTVSEDLQTYYPALNVNSVKYEVIIIKHTIDSEKDLNVLANDINIGGYDFKNETFTVSANFNVTDNILIGTEESPFMGVIEGNNLTITITGDKGLFGYNAGTVQNLNVLVAGNIFSMAEAGAIAYINSGTITNCYVEILDGGSIEGVTAGAIAGTNNGSVNGQSEVKINPAGYISGKTVGGAIGISNGYTNDISGTVYGAITGSGEEVYAGGLIGFVREGVSRRLVNNIMSGAEITANGDTAYAGGMVGRTRSFLSDCILYGEYGSVSAEGPTSAAGEFAGISDSNIPNSWMVMNSYDGDTVGVGDGPQSVNLLTIYGNGKINYYMDQTHGAILFYKDESFIDSTIDGWYTAQNTPVSENPVLGNVSGEDYAPSTGIMGRKISVVFINTNIFTVQDLINLADAVNGGMSSRDIIFTLMNDLDIVEALPDSIGTSLNGFNFSFDGNNNTINIHSYTAGANASIFGHIGSAGKVYNLTVKIYGVIGDETSLYAGGIVAENEGIIDGLIVDIIEDAYILSNTSGGIAGINHNNGVITNCTVNVLGSILASGAIETDRAGGIAGRNGGIIEKCVVNIIDNISAISLNTPFAGGITGQNTGIVRNSEVTGEGMILASTDGPYNSFSGGVTGSNTGTLSYCYVEADAMNIVASGEKINYAGAITGSNKNFVTGSVAIVGNGGTIVGNNSDSGIGYDDSSEKVSNTWVIVSSEDAKSNTPAVNTMLLYPGIQLAYDTEQFALNNLMFRITEQAGYFAVYDDLSVEGENNVLLENVNKNEYTPSAGTKGYYLRARNSDSVSSATELKALSYAVSNDGVNLLEGAEISLFADITVSGDYEPIGNINNKFKGIFLGNGYRITIDAATTFTGNDAGVTYGAVFGYNLGEIYDLIVDIKGNFTLDKIAGIAIDNINTIDNCVVYLVDGEIHGNQLTGAIVTSHTGVSLNNNWTISDDLAFIPNLGKIIYINGKGYIDAQISLGQILFEPITQEDSMFAGWVFNDEFVLEDRAQFDSDLTENGYIAEFIMLEISLQADLANMQRLIEMGFDTNGVDFKQINDIELTGDYTAIGSQDKQFEGVYDGLGYKLTLNAVFAGEYAGVFANLGRNGIIQNIILEIASYNAPEATVKGGIAAVSEGAVYNSVVYGDDDINLIVGVDNGTITDNLWIVSTDDSVSAGVNAGLILISGDGNALSSIDAVNNQIGFTAETTEDTIFAGWYKDDIIYGYSYEITMSDQDIGGYQLIFISAKISTEAEFTLFADAVSIGFDMEGYTISLINDILLDNPVTAGDNDNPFKGAFDGDGYSITVNASIIGDYATLFAINEGTITELRVIFNEDLGEETNLYAGLVGINNGSITSTVVTLNADMYAVMRGAIAADNSDGEIVNSWLVTSGNYAPTDSGEGNLLATDELAVASAINAGQISFTAEDTAGKFAVWYTSDEYTATLTDGVSLNTYQPDISINGAAYAVKAIDTVNIAGELTAFAEYVNSGNDFATYTIFLNSDIVINDELTTIGNSPANSFKGSLDGQGNTITISENVTINGDYAGLFGVNEGVILDLIVVLNGSVIEGGIYEGTVAALNNGIILNSVVYVNGGVFNNHAVTDTASEGQLNNCWYILNPALEEGWAYTESAYSITIRGNGSILTDIDDSHLTFTATADADILFAGWAAGGALDDTALLDTDVTKQDLIAEFIELNIDEEADLINLARVIDEYDYDTLGLVFEVVRDITASDEFVSLGTASADFSGIINGNFHIINIDEVNEAAFNGLIAYGEGAEINALAVVRNTAFGIYSDDVIVRNGDATMINTMLVTPIQGMTAGEGAEIILVGETEDLTTGDVDITEEEGSFVIIPVPNSEAHYAFRGFMQEAAWIDIEDDRYIVPEDGGNITQVIFRLRYTVDFRLTGIAQGEAPENTPEITGEGEYWYNEDTVTLEVINIGNGYLFRGIFETGVAGSVSGDDLSVSFATPDGDKSYEAVFELISFAYLSLEYNAERQAQAVSNDDIDAFTIGYTYKGIDGTDYPESEDAPVDAGNYKVTAVLTNTVSGLVFGIRTVGYEITPAPLRITVLQIKDKYYDTTDAAEITGTYEAISFDGIKSSIIRPDSADYISLENISFKFDSDDAGTWNIIVSCNELVATEGAPEDFKISNYWLGTEIGEAIMVGADPKPLTATIMPLEIEILADTGIQKVYGETEDPELTFTYLTANVPYEGDYFTGSLSRESGEDVGIYKINKGDLKLSDNYKLIIYTTGAHMQIVRRTVIIEIAPAEKQYADTDPTFTYIDMSTEPLTGIVNNDKLNLSWNYPKDALPSETPYTVEALFNPLLNPNYNVISELTVNIDGITCKIIKGNVYTVHKRTVTVEVKGNDSKIYGDPDLTIKVNVTNNYPGDNVYAYRDAGENVGAYAIYYYIANSQEDVTDRYEIIYKNDTGYSYTIRPRPIYINPSKVEKVYGEEDPEEIPFEIPEEFKDIVSGILKRDQGNDVGEYSYSLEDLIVSDNNYELRLSGGSNFIIVPRPLTITLTQEATKIYGAVDPSSVEFLASGFVEGDTGITVEMTGLIRIESGEDAASYQISGLFELTGANSENYMVDVVPGLLTIQPRPITIATDSKEMTYGDSAPDISYAIRSGQLIDGDTLELIFNENFFNKGVGKYDIIPDSYTNANYDVTVEPGKLTITKRKIVLVFKDSFEKVKGEDDPEFSHNDYKKMIKLGRLVGNDKFKGSIGREEGEKPGVYLYNEGDLNLGKNYELEILIEDNASLTITRPPVSFVPIAAAGGGGVVLIGAAITIITVLRKIKAARIPI